MLFCSDFNEVWVKFVDLAYEECPFCVGFVTREYEMGFIFNCVWAECLESFFSYDLRSTVASFTACKDGME